MPLSEFELLAQSTSAKAKPSTSTSPSPSPSLSSMNPTTTTSASASASTSTSLFYLSDTEFAELLWDNGQIVTHDHSSRPKKFPQSNGNGNGSGNGYSFSNKGKSADIDITDSDFPANDILRGADNESMVPWIPCSLQDHPLQLQLQSQSSPFPPVSPFQDDFYTDFLEGFAGATTTTTTLAFATTQPPAASGAVASTSTSTQLLSNGKGETTVTNFSLFKERLASGARASTSTPHVSEHKDASEGLLNKSCANKKESSKIWHEPVLASSSVCSVNDDAIESTEPKHAGKRKIMKGDESSSNSERIDDESAGEKRIAIGRGSFTKKSCAAEVHNLSERRRRERINEKMKALRQLIPNCNKADKASMLEDAIEYLKTLQLQAQMMSIGNKMYMPPPVMMPPMMHSLRAPHMAQYPPLGMGMYQMGMYAQLHPQQFIQGPPAMHSMIPPMPLHSQVQVSAPVSTRQTTVVSSSENAVTAATGVNVGSTLVRETTKAVSPAKPDPKAEML